MTSKIWEMLNIFINNLLKFILVYYKLLPTFLVVSSVKPKKKALLDVGNTIHQQKQTYSEGKKMDGNWKMEKTTIIGPKTKSSVCSPALTSSDDLIDDHNWSVCEKYLQGKFTISPIVPFIL